MHPQVLVEIGCMLTESAEILAFIFSLLFYLEFALPK